jgi:hypothetical protein
MADTHRCPQCGAELAQEVAQGLCPKCLMKAGLGSRTEAGEAGTLASPDDALRLWSTSPVQAHVPPEAGKTFGPYRLVRLLGQGGMGTVYEAEQMDSGRRVALKILSQSLDSAEARARFLREGRLAASVNHPNSVYIYGTEEIEGTPVIAMELVPGGTLEDRIKQKGPMPAPEAVDAILQIIEGLEAAQAVGVLHRDVKPSNCFIENDGTVKVGDFGLSISTKGRAETNLTLTGTFLGTPAFSSPEQLKGDELDVRSDIYAVGVTLYYLLTGKTPFKADNLVRFVATVLERPAESPATLCRDIPKGLCAAVLRCLEKLPARRFRNYGELRAALLPYASAAPTPATLGWRVLAYLVDMAICSAVMSPVGYLLMTRTGWPTDPAGYSPLVVTGMVCGFVLWMLYWALTEGLWGASLGKAVCRLRVVGPGRNVPGVPRALLRAAIFLVLPVLPTWIYMGLDPRNASVLASQPMVSMALSFSQFALMALLFATVRRRNGFAGLHDLASGTRIIQKAAREVRPVLQSEEQPQPVSEATPKIGPYYVLDRFEKADAGELLLGYDARLLRKVWIRRLPDGAPPAAAAVRGMSRATRLRWLGGSRAPGENWDAYEAPAGKPLVALIARPQPWRSVRYWLMDLAEELAAALKDGTVPAALALDRVWITAGGRAKLLDFAAPGAGGSPAASRKPVSAAADAEAAKAFLNQVAVAALEGRVVDAAAARGRVPAAPLPLQAREFLAALPAFAGIGPLASGLKPLLQKVASVTHRRRLGLVAACAALPIFMGGIMVLGQYMMRYWMESQPDIMPLQMCLIQLTAMEKQTEGTDQAKKVRAMEVYIADRFGKAISDPVIWSSPVAVAITPDMRERARQIVAKYPNPSEKEIAEAKVVVEPFVGGIDGFAGSMGGSPLAMAAMQAGFGMVPLALGSLFCAIAFRSGLAMLTFGVVAVKRDGSRAGRLRVFWRALVTWSPILFGLVGFVALGSWLFGRPTDAGDVIVVSGIAGGIALGLFAALAVVSALMPERGLQDRLAGTWLVPR